MCTCWLKVIADEEQVGRSLSSLLWDRTENVVAELQTIENP